MSKYPGRIVTDLAPAGYSVYFDGSGDRIQTASSAALALGTNDFSIEWWERRDAIGSDDTPVSTGDYSSAYASCLLGYSGTAGYISTNGASWNVLNGPAYVDPVLPNVWNHFVYTRSGTAFRVFMNGKLSNYVTGSGSVVQNNNRFNVGGNSGGAQYDFPGYISNFRIVIGSIPTQYQTSSTTVGTQIFTPPTQLFPVTNTVLLACNSPSIIDQSSNNIAFTVTGNAAVSTVTPFTAYIPYDPSMGASTPGVWTLDEATQAAATRQWNMYDPYFNLTTLLLRSGSVDGSQNNTFLDSSSNSFPITRNPTSGPNAPTQGTFSPFSQTGWSNFFDGSDDFLQRISPSSALGDWTSTNWTLEYWIYANAFGQGANTGSNVFGHANDGGTAEYWSFGPISTGAVRWYYFNGSSPTLTTTTTLTTGRWYHLAFVNNSANLTIYIDGVASATGTIAGTPQFGSAVAMTLGKVTGASFNGYVSNLRITQSAVYTSNFTPSTAPLTAISGTQLLMCQSNRFRDISTNAFVFTPSGTPSVQAFSPFYPTAAYTPQTIGGSGFFDGTGDYLTVADSANLRPPNGDFTYEIWWYPTSLSGIQGVFTKGNGVQIYLASGVMNCALSSNNTTTYFINSPFGAPSINAWNHIAVVRSGNNYFGYLNGSRTLLGTSTSIPNTGTNAVGIGAYDAAIYFTSGYLSGARYTTGALYTASPAPIPTAPPTTIVSAGTCQLLVNFTNAAITDATGKNVLETVGNAQASTSVRNTRLVTTPSTSMYFDGTGDYLVTPSSPVNILGSGDFTVEFWAYPSNTSTAYRALVASENYAGTTGGWSIYQNGTSIEVWLTAGQVINATSALTATTWQHVALSRASGTVRLFVNGTSIASASNTAEWTGQRIFIGDNNYAGIDYFYNGYLDDLRITRGFARYRAAFTPPRSRLQEQ